MNRIPSALLALACLLPLVGADGEVTPYAPSRVLAGTLQPAAAGVAWTPGPEPADSYRVYGHRDGRLHLLLDTTASPAYLSAATYAAVVPAGYDGYAVSGVREGTESERIFAEDGCQILVQVLPTPGVSTKNCPTP